MWWRAAAGPERLDPARLGDFTLTSHDGRLIPLSQIGKHRGAAWKIRS